MKAVSLIIAAALVGLGYASLYVVAQGEVGVVSQFGQPLRVDTQPGLHLRWPLLQQVERVDTREQLADSGALTALTADQQPVELALSLQWQVQDSRHFIDAQGSQRAVVAQLRQWAEQHLQTRVRDHTLSQLTAMPAAELFGPDQGGLARQLQSQLGVQLLGLQLRQITVPQEGLDALYQQMQSSQGQLATQLRAQAQAEADKIQAQAAQKARQQVADARIQAARIRGEGEAKALQITAAAAAQEPTFFAFYQHLRAYRAAFEQGGNVWILRPDTGFLKSMDAAPAPATASHGAAD